MVQNDLWGGSLRILTNQTIYGRVMKSLPLYMANKRHNNFFIKKINDEYANQLNYTLSSTVVNEKQNSEKNNAPLFTYMHLNIPHPPFLFDSTGKRMPDEIKWGFNADTNDSNAYLNYLLYCNKRILSWIDEIKLASHDKAVILIMSDHGAKPPDIQERQFDNLNAVFIPGGNYSGWYKGFSNVNQFRVLFNKLFKQSFELKPDITP